MKHFLGLLGGLAIAIAPSTLNAQIEWAAGAPGGTTGGSIQLVDGDNVFLATGIAAAQVAPTTGADYTISAWINSNTPSAGGQNALNNRWWFGTGNQGLHLGVQTGAAGLTTGHWSNDSTGTTSVAIDTWVHATHVYRAGVQEIYFNGVLDSSVALGAPNFDDSDLQIGSRNGSLGPSWGGFIDDVAIFTSALSAADVAALAADSSLAPSLGAAAYYDFEDDQTGTTAANLVDVAVSGLTGTDGSPAFQELDGIGAALPPVAEWTTGAPGGTSGGAVLFDGSSNLATGIDPALVGGDRGDIGGVDYTISAWIRSDIDDNGDGNADDGRWFFGTGNQGIHLGIFGNADGANFSTLQHGHWSADTSGTTVVQANTWVHATFTFDADGGTFGDGESSIYLNGVLESTTDQIAPNRAVDDLIIGGRNGAGGPGWIGAVDDVAIFTSVLSAGDVASLAADASQAVSLGAAAYYNFEDDQTGTTALNLVDVAVSGLTSSAGDGTTPALQALERIGPSTAPPMGLKGDVDLSGQVDFADIDDFITVLQSGVFQIEVDCDCDGDNDFSDIPAFILILQNQ